MANGSLQSIVKSYDGQTNVVDGIDLDIADSEFVVLVGPRAAASRRRCA